MFGMNNLKGCIIMLATVRVQFITSDYDRQTEQFVPRVRAELTVDGPEVLITGDERWVSLEIGVIDPETRSKVTFESDPERWAQLLPLAYRSGDVRVEIA